MSTSWLVSAVDVAHPSGGWAGRQVWNPSRRGHRSSRQYDEVGAGRSDLVDARFGAQSHVDAETFELTFVERDDLGDLGPGGRLAGQPQLAAERLAGLVERDVVPCERRRASGLHARRPTADDQHVGGRDGSRNEVVIAKAKLSPGAGVDDA